MPKISILLGSRGRPTSMVDMWLSFWTLAQEKENLECVFYLDSDDKESIDTAIGLVRNFRGVKFYVGPRIIMSEMTNKCYENCTGDIVLMAGDDLRCKTEGWDEVVRKAFEEFPDQIALIYGHDCSPNGSRFATHPFLSRKAIDILGYVCPPYYHHAYSDTHLWEIYSSIGRTKFIPIITHHYHPDFKTREFDETDKYQRENLGKHRPDLLYLAKRGERLVEAGKLSQHLGRRVR